MFLSFTKINFNFSSMLCLLCHSPISKQLDEVPVKKIVSAYKKVYKEDFEYLFNEPYIKLLECNDCGLRFYSPHITGDDHFYNTLQKTNWYYRDDKEEYSFAASYIKQKDRVLDIGCGKGAFAKFIPQAQFKGLEFSSDAIKTGRQKEYDIIPQSIEEHAKEQCNQYDVVTAFQVLEHVSNISQFVESAAACVKPNGKLIIAVPSDDCYIKFITNAFLNMPPHHISRWTDKALQSLGSLINFTVDEIHHAKLDPFHQGEYLHSYIERLFRFNLKERAPLVTDGTIYRVQRKMTDGIVSWISKRGVDEAWYGMGQTVIAVYSK